MAAALGAAPNADERTLELRRQFPAAVQNGLNLRAAIAIDQDAADLIATRRSFVVETMRSSDKYQDGLLAAKAASFKIGLIYISLYPPGLSPRRVSERATKGCHDA